MLQWKRLCSRSSRLLCSLTGLTRDEFEKLISVFSIEYENHKPLWSKVNVRQRKPGAGQKPAFPCYADTLLFILIYFKVYPTQDFHALLFGATQSWACKWVQRLTPVLEATLGKKKVLPKRVPRISNINEFLEEFPELSFIIDGTERPRTRPQDKKKQKSNYSGKKKMHTLKNTILSDLRTKKVVAIGSSFPGSTHDKKMIDTEPIKFPPGTDLFQDTGYQGYAPDGVRIHQPRKKKRGVPRTPEDKAFNHEISGFRVRVEHTIGGIKRSNIISQTYRNRKEGFDDLSMLVAGGLHNYRTEMRPSL